MDLSIYLSTIWQQMLSVVNQWIFHRRFSSIKVCFPHSWSSSIENCLSTMFIEGTLPLVVPSIKGNVLLRIVLNECVTGATAKRKYFNINKEWQAGAEVVPSSSWVKGKIKVRFKVKVKGKVRVRKSWFHPRANLQGWKMFTNSNRS